MPVRLNDVEAFLKRKPITAEVITAAAAMSDGLVASRTRREYRREVIQGFIERALVDALEECGTAVIEPARGTSHG